MTQKRRIGAEKAEGRDRPEAARARFRFNPKAAVCLAVVAALVGAGYVGFGEVQGRRVRSQLLAESAAFEESGKVDLAIRNLDHYLDAHPDDLPVLEQLARLMADTARDVDEAMAAANVNDRLLRKDSEGPGRQETRRRLVSLYVRCGDSLRASAIFRLAPNLASFDLRYRAAEAIARDLIARERKATGRVGPRDHRLLAMALEGLAVPGNKEALRESVEEYEAALGGDPGDVVTADRLAQLCQERLDDPARGERILDDLAKARPDSAEVRLVRYRFFLRVHRGDRARAELVEAAKLAPADLDFCLTAAGDALRRGDAAAARGFLAAIPEGSRHDLRVRMMRGMVDFNEEQPDEAINGWRQGLLAIGGTDADLTWWLAHALLQMGRVAEARPLVAQYRRLSGDEAQPLHRVLQAELDEKTGRPIRAILGLEWARDRIGEYWLSMVQMALGRCYESIWDRTRALEAYRRASRNDPHQPEPRIAAARLLSGQPDEAVRELQRGLDESPDEPSLRLAMAGARLRQQAARPPSARRWADFDRALALASETSPTNSTLSLMRADRLALSGNLPGAIALLEQSAGKSPRNASLWTAWAEGLVRSGRPLDALKVLDRAAEARAAGDRAPIRIARAKLLLALGHGREAREALIRGEEELPMGDRPAIWEALGGIDSARGDYESARNSYAGWARLVPDDPRPRLALLDLAHAAGDEASARATVEALREVGGPEDVAWRLCRAHELLWAHGTTVRGLSHPDPSLMEAHRLLESVLVDAPEIPAAHLLLGEILEKIEKPDEAIAAYRRAWDRGSDRALPRLVELLIRRRKFDDLAGLRLKIEAVDLDRLSAAASIRVGDVEATDRFARQAAEDAKGAPGTRAWQARMYEAIGKPDQADASLRAIVEKKPAEAGPWLDLVRSLASHGKDREVAEAVARARAQVKDDPAVLEARLRWAAGDRPAADRAFQAALAGHPADSPLRILASRFYEETGRPAEAASALEDALRIDPGDRGASRQLAVVLSSDPASWPRAMEMVGAEARPNDRADDRLARALVLSRAPDAARKGRAIAMLEALADDLPVGSAVATVARTRLARLLLEAGRAEQACRVALFLAESGTDAPAIALFAEALLRAGKPAEALHQLDRLAALDPGDPAEAALRVRLIVQQSRPADVARALEEAAGERRDRPGGEALGREAFAALLALNPPDLDRAERVGRAATSARPSYSWMPAQVRAIRGRADEAIELCRPAAESSNPEDRWAAAQVAMTLATRNGTDLALRAKVGEVLEAAYRRDTRHYGVVVLLAMFRHIQGRFEDEVKLYRDALAIHPGDPASLNNLAWALSEGLHRPEEALAPVEELIARVGRRPVALDTRGVILSRIGRHDEAIKDLEEAVAAAPSAAGHFHLAMACRKAGREDGFRRSRDLALKAGLSPDRADPTERDEVASILKF